MNHLFVHQKRHLNRHAVSRLIEDTCVLDILMPRFLVKARVQDQDLVLGQGVAATEYEVEIFV